MKKFTSERHSKNIIVKRKDKSSNLKLIKLGFLQIGFSKGVWGVAIFDKISYINFFGIEILK